MFIIGLKPTHGLVPYTGVVPCEPTIDHIGPMARTVEDCALMLEVNIKLIRNVFNKCWFENNILEKLDVL